MLVCRLPIVKPPKARRLVSQCFVSNSLRTRLNSHGLPTFYRKPRTMLCRLHVDYEMVERSILTTCRLFTMQQRKKQFCSRAFMGSVHSIGSPLLSDSCTPFATTYCLLRTRTLLSVPANGSWPPSRCPQTRWLHSSTSTVCQPATNPHGSLCFQPKERARLAEGLRCCHLRMLCCSFALVSL